MSLQTQQLEGLAEAQKVCLAHMPPRYIELDTLERWVEGRQYDGWPDWFAAKDVPIMERAPCVRYLLAKDAIDSNVDLVLGEGRFPVFTTNPGEDDTEQDDELGLDEDESKVLDRFIQVAVKQSRFKAAARDVLRDAQASRSSAIVLGVKAGRLVAQTVKAKWCSPEFDEAGDVTRLVIQYPYVDRYQDAQGKWKARARVFRRVIDDQTDTTYLPADATLGNVGLDAIVWKADPKQTVTHGFGFCPVKWYAFMRGCETSGSVDGRAIHELALQQIHGVDMALSLRHRAAIKASDPQWVITGIDPDANLTEEARTAYPATANGGPINGQNPVTSSYGGPAPAQKRGVDIVWKIANPAAKAELHVLPSDALKAISEHVEDLVTKLAQNFAHVLMDPNNIKTKATMSGKAMEAFRERQLNRCDQIRDDIADGLLVPAMLMMLRIVAKVGDSGLRLRIKGYDKAKAVLAKFLAAQDDPDLTLVWGSYAKPDPEEENQIITGVVAASSANPKIVTQRMVLEKFKRHNIFAIESVEQALEDLKEESDEAMQHQLETAHALGSLADDGDTGNKGGAGGDAPAGTPKTPRVRGGRPPRRGAGGKPSAPVAQDGGA
jgi:hypothetical protein